MKWTKKLCILLTGSLLLTGLTACDDDYDEEYYDDEYYDEEDYDEDYDEDFDEDYDDEDNSEYAKYYGTSEKFDLFSNLGSAGELSGTTVLVTIFADDSNTSWSENDDNDIELASDCLYFEQLATDWISKQAKSYGCDASFVYDWVENDDLYAEASLDVDLVNGMDDSDEGVYAAGSFIEENIDSEEILKKYGADNIIYMFLLNTPDSNEQTSCTWNWYEDISYPYEMCFMNMHCEDEEETPAAFAHEILHTFGAPDLYSADEDGTNYGITKKFVSKMENNGSNDIMFTTYDEANDGEPNYDTITNEFSEIDAYYVGITDHSKVVEKWGFEKSQH